jgi:hypothetical protein
MSTPYVNNFSATDDKIKSTLLKLKHDLETRKEHSEELVGEEKWRCGYTAGYIQDTFAQGGRFNSIVNKRKPVAVLPTVLDRVFAKNQDAVAYVNISCQTLKGPISHTMIWILTKDTAHTLQSWENVKPYAYWHVPLDKFKRAIKVISGNVIDSRYKRAFAALTSIEPTHRLWKTKSPKDGDVAFEFNYATQDTFFSPVNPKKRKQNEQ